MTKAIFVFSLVTLICAPTCANEIHILPNGTGSQDGSNWHNALAGQGPKLQEAWNQVKPGGSLLLGSGNYENVALYISNAPEGAGTRTLRGIDTGNGFPSFTGQFKKEIPEETAETCIQIAKSVSDIKITNIIINQYGTGIFLEGCHARLNFSNLEFREMREGIRSEGGGTADNILGATHDVIVNNCQFVHFTKRAIRLQQGNFDWTIEGCHADAGGKEWATESFQICYQVGGNLEDEQQPQEQNITFANCVALNCYNEGASHTWIHPVDERYWNGDGFSVEAKVSGMSYINCISMHHTDAGWDDKSDGPIYIDCVAIDNKRNFRLWGQSQPAFFKNVVSAFPYLRGGNSVASNLWTRSNIEADNCKFIHSGPVFIDLDTEASPEIEITFNNCLLLADLKENVGLFESKHLVLQNSTVVNNVEPAQKLILSTTPLK